MLVVLPIGALLVSTFSLILAYYIHATRLRDARDEAMRTVATRAVILWEQAAIIATAQVTKSTVDSYMFCSIQKNARRVEEALDQAVRVGLFDIVLGDREHSLPLYAAFLQGLTDVEELENPEDQPLEAWTREHFVMGLVRLLDTCRRYRTSVLPSQTTQSIGPRLDQMLEKAWTYASRTQS